MALLVAGFAMGARPSGGDEPAGAGQEAVPRLEAVRRGVQSNLDLLARRLETRRREVLARAAWQAYTPSLILDGAYAQSPNESIGRDRLLAYAGGIGWRSPVGTSVTARLAFGHALGGTPGTDVTGATGLLHDGVLALSLAQPLLRGGWLEGAALPLREARLLEQIQRELFRDELNALIVDIESAWYDLAVAEAELQIKTRSRDRAKKQFEDTAENIRRGILAPGEIYVVDDNVVFFEQELLRVELGLRLARRRLARLLALTPDAPIGAGERLSPPDLQPPDPRAAVEEALRSSPRIGAQRLRLALANVRLAFSRNQWLPALDLTASLSLSSTMADYGGAWGRLFASPAIDGRVGLSVSLPVVRGPVDAAVAAADIDRQQQDIELRSQDLRARFDVADGLTDLGTNLRILRLSQRQVELAERKLGVEAEKYKNGLSTLVDVVRFQRDFDNALISLQRNIRTVALAEARLLATQGILYRTVGVEVR